MFTKAASAPVHKRALRAPEYRIRIRERAARDLFPEKGAC